MSDPAAFLRAIIDHPDDDGPRLVYADWLDERGDPRGEFVRVQCELAESQHGGMPNKRFLFLKTRERELLKAHRQDWLTPLVEIFGHNCPPEANGRIGWSTEFRRGFVEAVTLSAADWLGWPCGRCGDAETNPATPLLSRPGCSICRGKGTVPGHAAALVAATPLRKVRLTTNPNLQSNTSLDTWRLRGADPFDGPFWPRRVLSVPADGRWQEALPLLLAAEWPGIIFELPPTFRDVIDTITPRPYTYRPDELVT